MPAIQPPDLPFSQACENNQAPILSVLAQAFADRRRVLEIGSGTGQHGAYFAPRLPHLIWQTSDLSENHAGIRAWQAHRPAPNLLPPCCWICAPVTGPRVPSMRCSPATPRTSWRGRWCSA